MHQQGGVLFTGQSLVSVVHLKHSKKIVLVLKKVTTYPNRILAGISYINTLEQATKWKQVIPKKKL